MAEAFFKWEIVQAAARRKRIRSTRRTAKRVYVFFSLSGSAYDESFPLFDAVDVE
jgi:hypothetical protein